MKKILYIGWIGYKNLGDELMYDLFKEQVQKLGNEYDVDMVCVEYRFLKNVSPEAFDLIVLGGGSIFGGYRNYVHPIVIDFLHQCLVLNKKIMIWGTGIDWLPKSAIPKLNNREPMHFAVTKDQRTKLDQVFNKSVWSGIRGPLTQKVLAEYGVGDKTFISGDPAFLLEIAHEEPIPEIAMQLPEEKTIGVNWGTSFNNIYGRNEIRVEDELAAALNHFLDRGCCVYLYSVWQTDLPPLSQLYSKLKQKEQVIFDQTLRHQNDLMKIIKKCQFTINFKLHANFLSLGADVPFIALGYRFKVFDFIESVQLEDFIIGTDEENISDKIIAKEAEIVQNRTAILTKIKDSKELYRKKIQEPFEHGLYI